MSAIYWEVSCVSGALRQRAESTIHATATKVENYDGRLEVDKRFSSLVSYFITYLAEIKFIEKKLEIPKMNL